MVCVSVALSVCPPFCLFICQSVCLCHCIVYNKLRVSTTISKRLALHLYLQKIALTEIALRLPGSIGIKANFEILKN